MTENQKDAFERLRIRDSESLALWARKRGLLSAYIEFRPPTSFMDGAWQVVRPGYKTDENALAVNKGRKTFTYKTAAEKHVAERAAKTWADYNLNGDGWRRIEGFGPNLFPNSVIRELKVYIPELISSPERQKANKSTARRKK